MQNRKERRRIMGWRYRKQQNDCESEQDKMRIAKEKQSKEKKDKKLTANIKNKK